jgi:hypothetical protein
MYTLLVLLLVSYARTVLGVPFVRDVVGVVVSSSPPRNLGFPDPGSTEFWFHTVVSVLLVLAGGVFSG